MVEGVRETRVRDDAHVSLGWLRCWRSVLFIATYRYYSCCGDWLEYSLTWSRWWSLNWHRDNRNYRVAWRLVLRLITKEPYGTILRPRPTERGCLMYINHDKSSLDQCMSRSSVIKCKFNGRNIKDIWGIYVSRLSLGEMDLCLENISQIHVFLKYRVLLYLSVCGDLVI